jgi:hypothetical protein
MFDDPLAEIEALLTERFDTRVGGDGVAGLEGDIVGLSRLRDMCEARRLDLVRRWETSGEWATDGARSARAALAARTGVTSGSAGADLRLARRLDDAPATREAFAGGSLSRDKASVVTAVLGDDATDTLRAAFAECEEAIVDAAEGYSAANTRWFVRHWAAAADPEGHQATYNDDYARRRTHLSQSFEGYWHEESFLDPEGGAIVKAAQDVVERRMFRQDRAGHDGRPGEARTPAQRRADAKVEIHASFLHAEGVDPATLEPLEDPAPNGPARRGPSEVVDHADHVAADRLPVDDDTEADTEPDQAGLHRRGTRPVVAVVADLERLAFDPTGVAYLLEGGLPLPQAALERQLCDCSVVRALFAGASQPLDVGRSTRVPNAATMRALVIRDGGCAFPDCDMPPRWCDAHHIAPWEDWGHTKVENLVLVCRHHHRLVHDHSWSVRLDERGRPRFRTPQGDELAPDPSPLDVARRGADLAQRDRRQRLDDDIGEAHRRRRQPGDPDG